FAARSRILRALLLFRTRRSSDLVSAGVGGVADLGRERVAERRRPRARDVPGRVAVDEHAADDAVAESVAAVQIGEVDDGRADGLDRKSTRLNSSHVKTSYAVFSF